ncbi:uroporphyrinogen-III synthase [Chitinophaga sp. CF118]|uniref:uroporphyrinogen-III synthase n=1 Tax=Chitinophaga sp. CF118 TaxID=1884367 RepID=UPI0008E0D513|nr:uroporphyrinogen-III synthase [Chitinophaga sp. CF118]SFD04293.1 uroporphyrinogen-III synthase [Chitinophaga sp. CF118]
MSVKILSTKELPASLLATAAEKGVHITVAKFIHIQPVSTNAILPAKSVVIFTSSNAVNNVNADNPDWQVFCLNGATLEAVKERFPNTSVIATATNATALAQQIIQQGNITSAVFFCGNKRRDELPDLLQQHGIAIEEIVVYETIEVPAVTTNDYDGIFFFSPSGVKSYFTANTPPEHTVCFAIGHTTANALNEHTTNKIIINPDVPSAEQMVQTAISYFNNIN